MKIINEGAAIIISQNKELSTHHSGTKKNHMYIFITSSGVQQSWYRFGLLASSEKDIKLRNARQPNVDFILYQHYHHLSEFFLRYSLAGQGAPYPRYEINIFIWVLGLVSQFFFKNVVYMVCIIV